MKTSRGCAGYSLRGKSGGNPTNSDSQYDIFLDAIGLAVLLFVLFFFPFGW